MSLKWIGVLLALWVLGARADDASLTILGDHGAVSFTRAQLLSRADVQTVIITDSIYRQRFTRFKAIPIANLFRGVAVPEPALIECDGADGFSAVIGRSRLFSADPNASRAYLAIEDPGSPWPALTGRTTTAGPYYLVWTDPEASAIGAEEWPFKVASFKVLSDPRAALASLYPADDADRHVQNGLGVFLKNCFACHKMNGVGAATIGPDLNRPANPTRYLQPQALAALIRDPASVRRWSGMGMRGFSAAAISDPDLADLIGYLAYMAEHPR